MTINVTQACVHLCRLNYNEVSIDILYMYKFSSDVIFADNRNPGFLQFYFEDHLLSTLELHSIVIASRFNFRG